MQIYFFIKPTRPYNKFKPNHKVKLKPLLSMITPLLFQQKGNGVLCPDKALAKCNKQIVLITKNSRFPGASQNEINSNIISSATTEVGYISYYLKADWKLT